MSEPVRKCPWGTLLLPLLVGCARSVAEAEARGGPLPAPLASEPPTFARDVAPLVHRACTPCHREGGSAPFPLAGLEELRRRGEQLLAVVESGYMPPWKPVAGYGTFLGSRALSDEERLVLRRWVEAGMPSGDMLRAPAPPRFPDGWLLGAPDVVLEMEEPFAVDPERFDQWRCFALPTDFGQQRFVRSIEIRPSNPRVVHHLIAYVEASGEARELREGDGRAGLEGMCATRFAIDELLGGWVPGLLPLALPEGLGLRLPAGADVLVDAHFQATGRPEQERTRVGLTFAEAPSASPVLLVWLGAKGMMIPPGATGHRVEDSLELPVDLDVIAILPHAHYVCSDVRVWAELPDGREEPLVWIDDWDFNWQDYYQYAAPVHLPRGSRIRCVFGYDNSAANARNPWNPPRRVVGGSRSVDEMASLFLQVALRDEQDQQLFQQAVQDHVRELDARDGVLEAWWSYLVQAHDRDGDLSLDAEEDAAATAFVDRLWEDRLVYLTALDTDQDGRLGPAEEQRIRRAIRAWHGERDR